VTAICPSCKKEVETRPTFCKCEQCAGTRYFERHMHNGVLCFGSGHGVKGSTSTATAVRPTTSA
jgi:hypothetical protein